MQSKTQLKKRACETLRRAQKEYMLSTTELADLFFVSEETMDEWLKGWRISERAAQRILWTMHYRQEELKGELKLCKLW